MYQNKQKIKFYRTGDLFFDRLIGPGLAQGDLISLCGETGSGKTSFLMLLIANNPKLKVSYFDLNCSCNLVALKQKHKIKNKTFWLYNGPLELNQIYKFIENDIKTKKSDFIILDDINNIKINCKPEDVIKTLNDFFISLKDLQIKYPKTTIILIETLRKYSTSIGPSLFNLPSGSVPRIVDTRIRLSKEQLFEDTWDNYEGNNIIKEGVGIIKSRHGPCIR